MGVEPNKQGARKAHEERVEQERRFQCDGHGGGGGGVAEEGDLELCFLFVSGGVSNELHSGERSREGTHEEGRFPEGDVGRPGVDLLPCFD